MADSEFQQLQKIQSSGGLNPVQQTRFDELSKGQGGIGGVDLNAPLAAAQAQKGQLNNLFAGQQQQSQDFLNRFTGAIQGQESSSAMSDRIGREIGLPTMQANAQNLQNTLFNLPSTYSKATTGFDVNANQLARVIGTKQAELAPAAELAQQNVQNAQNTLTTRLGYGQADQAKALIPFQTEQSLLSDRLARETSGYTQQMNSELDAIIAKMSAGITLSEGEKNRAQQLALAEQGFEQAKALASQQQQFTKENTPPNTEIIDLGGRKKLINKQTGQVISDLGSTSSGGSSGFNSYYGTSSGSGGFKPLSFNNVLDYNRYLGT